MLMYRTCRCCRRIWNKLLHTVFHILSIPCIAIAFIAVLDSHNLRTVNGEPAPIPNFYSLHSWIGLAAMGLFALQVTWNSLRIVVGQRAGDGLVSDANGHSFQLCISG